MRRLLVFLIIMVLLLTTIAPVVASAENEHIPFEGYTYNRWGSIEAPNGYAPSGVITGAGLGIGDFDRATDMFIRDYMLYVLDPNNERIVVIDMSDDEIFVERIIEMLYLDGNESPLNSAQGIFVTYDNKLLIADTGNHRVVMADKDGNITKVLTRPETDIFPVHIEFSPTSVLADRAGNIFVLIRGFFFGAAVYNTDGEFSGFFGANRVPVTARLLWDRFWRRIMTERQALYIARYVPSEFTNFDIDREGFIYTVTRQRNEPNQIKRINPTGRDILIRGGRTHWFGDLEMAMFRGNLIASSFIDVKVNDNLIIHALENQQNRIFVYDEEANLLFILGGTGSQKGLFLLPVAIETLGNDILVLDARKNNITRFSPTPFGEAVLHAVTLFNDGLFEDAVEPWNEVLRMNSTFELAYRGIGKALVHQGYYNEALRYFRLGQSREDFSDAFRYVRSDTIRNNFHFIATGIILLTALLLMKNRIMVALKKKIPTLAVERVRHNDSPFSLMRHPAVTTENLVDSSSMYVLIRSILVITFWFIAVIVEHQVTGFIFNNNPPNSLQVGYMFASTFGLTILFVLLNWAVSTLMDGSGTLRKIWIATSYALLPYAMAIFLRALLSNVILIDEMAFLNIMVYVAMGYSFILGFYGLREVHEYQTRKMMANLIITIIAIAITMFIFILFGSLVQELLDFFGGLYSEIAFRFA